MTRPAMAALGAALFVLGAGVLMAGVTVVDGEGHVLTVQIQTDPQNPSLQGLVIVDAGPQGTTTQWINSTFDSTVDIDPHITLNPHDGQPVVVWSRQTSGGSDLELAMTRRLSGGAWGPLDILTSNQTSDVEPRPLVDAQERAHIVWWPSGAGGYVYLQSFDVRTGQPLGPTQRPLEPLNPVGRRARGSGGYGDVGGNDDPWVGGLTNKASAYPCGPNPAAAPEHGLVMACGQPVPYQLSSCRLVLGIYDGTAWRQTVADLSTAPLGGTSVVQIVQALANARCQ